MFALPYVLHFLAHEFTRLSGWREALAFVFACSLDWFLFRHNQLVLNISLPKAVMDVAEFGHVPCIKTQS